MNYIVKSAALLGFTIVVKDTGTDNNGRWIVDPDLITKDSDYEIEVTNNATNTVKIFKIEIKHRGCRLDELSYTPKLKDLEAAVRDNVVTINFWSEITPDDELFPNGIFGVLFPEKAARMIDEKEAHSHYDKKGNEMYGGRDSIRLYQANSKELLNSKFKVKPLLSEYLEFFSSKEFHIEFLNN